MFTYPRCFRDIIGCWFLIQSPGSNCEHIRSSLDKHLARMRVKVATISDEDFAVNVNSVMTDISEKDKNLNEAHGR